MRQLQRRLQRDLDRIADRAPVSSESWEQLRQRIAAEPEQIEEEVIMLAPAEPTPTRPRWAPVALAFAAVAALLIAGIVVLRAADTDAPVADDELVTPTRSFDPAVDDLCTWVSGDDIVAHLTAAGADVEGPATLFRPETEPSYDAHDCVWRLPSGASIRLDARSVVPRPEYDLEQVGEPGYRGYVEYEQPGQILAGGYVIGHPALGDEISVSGETSSGWGLFSQELNFYPLGGERELIVGYSSEDELTCDDVANCDDAARRHESVLVRTAGAILWDLGWTRPAVEEGSAPATEVDWQYGASFPGELEQVAEWSGGLAAIMDLDGDQTPTMGDVWYSTDGVEWSEGSYVTTLARAEMLAGRNGDLFALTVVSDPDEWAVTRTLWHLEDGGSWTEVITSEAIDHIAVGPERLIAYGEAGFEVVGVFDTATLEPVEFDAVPEIDPGVAATDPATGEPFQPEVEYGQAVALDEGFLADVRWITGLRDDGGTLGEWRLMYSADGSSWIEHPAPPAGGLRLPDRAPVFDGMNLLSWPNRPWITDDGLAFTAATDPGYPGQGGPTGTADGFFTVGGGNRIHRSTDGVTWEELQAPPTWPHDAFPVANEDGEVQHGSVFTLGDRMVAIGLRGDFEGWVGYVNPTTEIWIADR